MKDIEIMLSNLCKEDTHYCIESNMNATQIYKIKEYWYIEKTSKTGDKEDNLVIKIKKIKVCPYCKQKLTY